MPYKLVRHKGREGGEWCVHKENADGSPGENRGCSSSREEAVAHMRALYAHEKKELEDSIKQIGELESALESELEELEVTDEHLANVQDLSKIDTQTVTTVTITGGSLSDLTLEDVLVDTDEYDEEEADIEDKAKISVASKNDLPDSKFLYIEPGGKKDSSGKTVPRSKRHFPVHDVAHIRNAIARIPQSNAPGLTPEKKRSLQARARKMLARANKDQSTFMQIVSDVVDKLKSLLVASEDEQNDAPLMLWKEADTGRLRWFARYSNNFLDDDNPPEIIAAESHQAFVDMVDRKEAAMPELWLWHVPEWKVGVADWLAYDDSGFALASGTVDVGKEAVVEQVASHHPLLSHGMPVISIVRDPDDPKIIRRHTTKEITLLPDWAAANKITGFILMEADQSIKEDDMAIPANKKQELVENWNINPELLDQLEQANLSDAAKATEDGRESKEKTEEVKEETQEQAATEVVEQSKEEEVQSETEENVEAEQSQAEPAPDLSQYPTREEVAEAITTVFTPYFERINQLSAQMEAFGKEIGALKEMKNADLETTINQLPSASLAALIAQRSRAVGDADARVKGNERLANSKPEEPDDSRIAHGIPFIDNMLNQKPTE